MRELIAITIALMVAFFAYHRGHGVGFQEATTNLRFLVGEQCNDIEAIDLRTYKGDEFKDVPNGDIEPL